MNQKFFALALLFSLIFGRLNAQLAVNEISRGGAASGQYIEFVVMGNRTCNDTLADIRNWIVDDNNGWLGTGPGQGIATGCVRFANCPTWGSVPYGSIILLYDNAHKNTSITLADDPTDANHDHVYVVPVSSLLMESHLTSPVDPSSGSYTYPASGYTQSGLWSTIDLTSGGDAVILVSPADYSAANFSFAYGTLSNSSNATVYNAATGNANDFYVTGGQYRTAAAWTAGNAPFNETPGAPNNALNSQWIHSFRTAAQPQTTNNIIAGCGSVVYNGVTYTSSTTVTDTIRNIGGCDSVYRINSIVIKNIIPVYQDASFWVCRSVIYNGVTYTASSDVTDTLRSTAGCDSVYRLTHINIQNITPIIQTVFLSGCTSVTYNGTVFTTTTNFRDSIKSLGGCDSIFRIVNIRVGVAPTIRSSTISACGSIVYNGVTYTDSAVLRDTLFAVNGCDSIYKVTNINVKKVVPENVADTMRGCNSLTFLGVNYTTNAVVPDTLRTPEGCDSVYRKTTILIQVITPVNQYDTLKGCHNVVYNSITYNASTVVNETIPTTLGCDSVYKHTNIIVKNITPLVKNTSLIGCSTVTYNGTVYSASAVIRDTVKTAEGCDSIYNVVNITIKLAPVTQTTNFTSCSNVFLNGTNYTTSIILRDTIRTATVCDSIYKVTVIDIQNHPVAQSQVKSGCGSVVFNGVTYFASTTVKDTLRSVQFCDSVYRTTSIVVKNIIPTRKANTVTGCNSVVFNGVTYLASTVVKDTLRTAEGCDSVFRTNTINVIIITPVIKNVTVTGCGSYVYNGVTYTISTTVADTLRTVKGCDSVYRTTVINIPVPVNQTAILSGCGFVIFHGIGYTTPTVVHDTIKGVAGCDSIRLATTIDIHNVTPVRQTITRNGCSFVVYNGSTYASSTTIRDTIRTSVGCDSIYLTVRIVIDVLPVSQTLVVNGCARAVYNGITYTSSTVVLDTLHSIHGCDSVYRTVNINIQNLVPVASAQTLFGCNSVSFNGSTYNASTVVLDTLRSVFGCDSVYRRTTITVHNILPSALNTTLTGCNSLVFHGNTYVSSTVLTDTVKAVTGCDSVYNVTNINIIHLAPVTQNLSFNGCNSYVYNGATYTSSTVFTDTVRSTGSCDSVYKSIRITIRVIAPVYTSQTFMGCNSVIVRGVTYNTSTMLYDTVRTALGCDSIYNVTNIIVQHITQVTDVVNIRGCGSVVFHGITYIASTTVRDTVRSIANCDSLYHITRISILTPVINATSLQGCNSLVFNGVTYSNSTVVRDTVRTSWGCDSIYKVTNINIQHITAMTATTTFLGCNSVVVNGVTYSTSTVLHDTLRTSVGCDSVYKVTNIIVQHITPVTDVVNIRGCGSLVFHGITYIASTTVRDTVRSIANCDSLYHITRISILTPVTNATSLQGCNSLVYNGVTYSNSTVVRDTVRTSWGCDSIYKVTTINIQHITATTVTSTFLGCNSVVVNGVTYSASTVLHDTLGTTVGCDSVYKVTNIIVQHITPVTDVATIRGCGSLVFHGITYTASATVRDTVRSIANCDSLYHITNINILTPVTNATSLQGCNSLVYNGITYTNSTVARDTVRTSWGCDSIYTIASINIQHIIATTATTTFLGCNSVVVNGVTYSVSTVLHDTLRTSVGCDSVYKVTNIIVQHITAVTDVANIRGCGSLVFHGITYTASATVTDTVRSIANCDSLYHITHINILTPVTNATSLQGCNSLVYNGVTYANSTVVRDTVRTAWGCDSIYNVASINIQHITATTATTTFLGCNSVVVNGVTYSVSTVLHDTLRTSVGCDSIYKVTNIIVQHITPVTDVANIRGCGSLVFHGITYTTSATVTDTVRSIANCDSLYHITHINILTPVTNATSLQGCNSLVYNGATYTASTVVRDTVRTSWGCDSIYKVTSINIQHITATTATTTFLGCNSVVVNGVNYSASTVLHDTLRTTVGCDSVYKVANIIVQHITPVTDVANIRGCGSLVFHGITYTASATVTDTVRSIANCDSLYHITHINILTPLTNATSLQGCNSLVYNGTTYTTSTVVRDTVRTAWGCDSIYNVASINIQHITATTATTTFLGCNSVVVNGVTYSVSTVLHDTLRTSVGCDSVYKVTNIIVQHITAVTDVANIRGCGSLVFHGITYTASATVTDTVRSIANCDSLYHITHINILTPVTNATSLQGCNSLVYNGATYTASTVVRDTVRTSWGCDSIYKVTSINIQHITATKAITTFLGCNSVVVNGVNYSASTVLHDTLRTSVGCDSVYKVTNIIVQHITPVTDVANIRGCGSLVFHGITYTASATVTDTVRSIANCDSLYHITHLNILNATRDTSIVKGCNSLVFNGTTYTASTTLRDTVRTAWGCDSVYKVTEIIIQNITANTVVTTFKSCSSVVVNGVTYTSSAVLHDTLRTTFGCDSIYKVTNIIVQHITPVADTATIRGCQSLVFHGITYTSSATVRDTVRSIAGCDSLYHITKLNILKAVSDTITIPVCNSLVFHGHTYTASTTVRDTVRTSWGCDSVYHVTKIMIQTIVAVNQTRTLYGCNSYVYSGVTYTISTTVMDTLHTTWGCDSVYRTNNIDIQNVTPVTHTSSLTGCRQVMYNGVAYTASIVVRDTLRTGRGCDSVYNVTHITVENFKVSLSANPNPCLKGEPMTLTTSAPGAYNVLAWLPVSVFPIQTAMSQSCVADSDRTITVIAASATGCQDTVSLRVTVYLKDNFFVPNTFTPNGDGHNDMFKAYGNNVKSFEMTVFNQWGEAICKTTDFYNGWDGKSKGMAQPTGVYVYVMRVTFDSGEVVNKKGTINLIR